MAGEHGVENAGLVLDVIAESGGVIEKMVKADGNVLARLAPLSELLDEVMMLARLDGSQLKKELGELDAADIMQLKDRFKAKFSLSDTQVEGLVEEGITLAYRLGEDVVAVVDYAKKIAQAAKKEEPAPVAKVPAAETPVAEAPSA